MTKEKFLEEIYSLNPSGNPELIYNYIIKNFINEQKFTFSNDLVTINLIIRKYKSYLFWWEVVHGKKGKYLSKEDKKVNIDTFLIKEMYEQDFIIPFSNRDNYLFGKNTDNDLRNKINDFLSIFNPSIKKEKISAEDLLKEF